MTSHGYNIGEMVLIEDIMPVLLFPELMNGTWVCRTVSPGGGYELTDVILDEPLVSLVFKDGQAIDEFLAGGSRALSGVRDYVRLARSYRTLAATTVDQALELVKLHGGIVGHCSDDWTGVFRRSRIQRQFNHGSELALWHLLAPYAYHVHSIREVLSSPFRRYWLLSYLEYVDSLVRFISREPCRLDTQTVLFEYGKFFAQEFGESLRTSDCLVLSEDTAIPIVHVRRQYNFASEQGPYLAQVLRTEIPTPAVGYGKDWSLGEPVADHVQVPLDVLTAVN